MQPAAITLAQDRAELSRLNAWLAACGAAEGIAPALLGDMKLCLNEAVTNIIDYGKADGRPLQITVTLAATGHELVATLEDSSFAFDPTQAPEPSPISSLETAQIGGFGISLMRSTASEIHYARIDGRNRLTLVCRSAA